MVHRFKRGREAVVLAFPDFRLEAGEHGVVVGPSGSGKSTLLHLLAGLLVASSGLIEVAGRTLSELKESERDVLRACNVGYVFQDFHLAQGYSALENVILGLGIAQVPAAERRARAAEALRAVDLGSRIHHYPRQLSTGERQRVALARATAHRPTLLLADEPTAHLDHGRSEQALRLLKARADEFGATLVVATHDPLVVRSFKTRITVAA